MRVHDANPDPSKLVSETQNMNFTDDREGELVKEEHHHSLAVRTTTAFCLQTHKEDDKIL